MNKYLIIGLFALAALSLGMWLKHDRDRLFSELGISSAQIVRLKADIESAGLALAARDELDKKYFEEMTHAKNENDRLSADLASGAKRVLVRASCPKSVPIFAGASGLDDAGATELTADARQDYLRLRAQIITTESQLKGLQEYYRKVAQVPK